MDLHVFPIDQLSIFYFLGKIHKKEKMVNNMFLFSSSLPTFITFDSEKNILKKQQKKKTFMGNIWYSFSWMKSLNDDEIYNYLS